MSFKFGDPIRIGDVWLNNSSLILSLFIPTLDNQVPQEQYDRLKTCDDSTHT